MATTTNFGWDTPDDTDLVKDGALAIRTLGSAIDTSLVDLKGGTTGQVLSKASNTDLDFTWSAADPLSILDAKGDLISATAADTPARLAVGANNTVVMAASGQSTGLRYEYPSILNDLDFVSGSYYSSKNPTTNAAVTAQEDRTHYRPFIVHKTTTFDRLGIYTHSTFSGTASVRLGIYNSTNGQPSTVLLDAGTVSCTASATAYTVTINQSLTPGVYFLASNMQTPATVSAFWGDEVTRLSLLNYSKNIGTANPHVTYFQNAVTGAFATASPSGSDFQMSLYTWIRAA